MCFIVLCISHSAKLRSSERSLLPTSISQILPSHKAANVRCFLRLCLRHCKAMKQRTLITFYLYVLNSTKAQSSERSLLLTKIFVIWRNWFRGVIKDGKADKKYYLPCWSTVRMHSSWQCSCCGWACVRVFIGWAFFLRKLRFHSAQHPLWLRKWQ